MMNMKSKPTGIFCPARGVMAVGGAGPGGFAALETRLGGLLVQKRNSDADSVPVSIIKIKVKYGSSFLEFNLSSQASFGDLKKMLAGPTGLHHEEQKTIFNDKERESRSFLDVAGVRDGSIIVLIQDVVMTERRYLEARKNAHMEKATKDISDISLKVDNFVKQVADLETQICSGKKVVEKTLLNLVEQLMTQLIKLDGIVADGDVKLMRRLQVKRVQKHIETLDKLKIRNSMVGSGATTKTAPLQQYRKNAAVEKMVINPVQKQQEHHNRKHRLAMVKPVVATTNWETYDSGMSAKMQYKSSASAVNYGTNNSSSRPSWEYFV